MQRDRDAAVERRDRAVQLLGAVSELPPSLRDVPRGSASRRSGRTSRSTRANGAGTVRARSSGQSRKSITQRDGDPSGRELRSSPTRYGRTTSALRWSSASITSASSGERTKPIPTTTDPWNDRSRLACSRWAFPLTRLATVSDGVIAGDLGSVEHAARRPAVASRPDGRHLQVRAAGPRLARDRTVNRPAALSELVQPDLARVTLRNRIRRDQPEAAARAAAASDARR